MTDWPLVPLGELLTQVSDRHPVEAGRIYPNIGLYSFGRGVFEKEPIDGSTFGADYLFRVGARQFIYSRLKAFEGAYALVPDCAGGAFVTNEFPTFEIESARTSAEFLGWYFRRPMIWQDLARFSTGVGARRERLHPQKLLSHRIPLPPLREQQRIAESLSSLWARVDEAKRLRAEIQSDAAALLHSVFHHLVQGAAYRPLGEVAPIVRRPVEIDTDKSYDEIGIRSFHKGTFFKGTSGGADISHKKMFQMVPGDLVFSNIMAWEGAIAVVRPEDEGRIGVHRFITCLPELGLADPDFLWFYFQTEEGFEKIVETSPATIARNRTLNAKMLPRIEVPVPAFAKQRAFAALRAKVQSIQDAQAANQAELDALLPAVLDKVFKGRL
ncbi:restriction endonuclease subunit S [Thiohalocapsa sp. ML1]|uniref:restriction endonuclease subunit S n=1 Tax=Thiohalocapsa sp. ML1 TaxID=1431688 RepID=UPI0007322863|nr:restriction endonuclease subunit S [Thiohalocapsa sp. ML1]